MNKYKNKIVKFSNKQFHSKKELERYLILRNMELRGEISNLECQVKFTLIKPNEIYRAVTYVADFVYDKNDEIIVEDVKPNDLKWYKKTTAWAVYNIKRKLMYDKFGIIVREI